ncbi:PepSY domain-containing protein [Thiohalocapsa marina]|uniref:PepSY domain-containing protein n=2 Tax=Thiohalocapsa marina TaxID=424902 RepID=A0A5M8FQX6_9GAMM|nr:PepSY domain-containing protein [Thiohalocapsa marina]KAA6186356.1 PepSY domain-containing protein [Thiohalocapsa marina]
MVLRSIVGNRAATSLVALVVFSVAAVADPDGEDDAALARRLFSSGVIKPLSYFIERAHALRDGLLIEAKLEYESEHDAYVYEIYLLDDSGQVWEMEFDAATGELYEYEEERED